MTGIRIELQMEDGSFTSGLLRARQGMKSFKQELERLDPHYKKLAAAGQDGFRSFKRMDDQSRSLLGRLRDITIVGAGAAAVFQGLMGSSNGLIGSIVRMNSEMERLRYQLAGMSTAANPMKEAADQVGYLQEQAKSAPFSLSQITASFVKLKVAGLDPMQGSLRSLMDGIAAFGGNDEAFHRITLGITQMAGKGVIQMEELRQQLGESMPAAMSLMARSMGVSIAELTKAIASGRVEAKSALTKWFEQVDLSFGGSADQMMKTFSGQMARMKTAFTQRVTTGEMGEAFESLKTMMGDVVEVLESPAAAEFFDKLGRGMQGALDLGRRFVGVLVEVKGWVESLGTLLPLMIGGALVGSALRRTIQGVNGIRVSLLEVATAGKAAGASIASMTAASLAAQAATAKQARQAAFLAAKQADPSANARLDPTFIAANSQVKDLEKTAAKSSITRMGAGILGAVGPAISGLSRVLGMLGPIALGVSVVLPLAWQMGKAIFSWATGAKDAREEVKQTAAEIRQAAQDARDLELDNQGTAQRDQMGIVAARQRREMDALEGERVRASLRADRDRAGSLAGDPGSNKRYNETMRELNQIHDRMLALEEAHIDEMTQVMVDGDADRKEILRRQAVAMEEERERNINQGVAAFRAQVAAETQEERRAYNERNGALSKELDERTAAEIAAGRTGARAREWYHEELKKADLELLQARENASALLLADTQARVDAGELEQDVLTAIRAEHVRLQDQIAQTRTKDYAIDMLTAPESEEKKMERLNRYLTSTQERVKELGAELNGASGAVAKLVYQIKRGDFGNLEDGSEYAEKMRYMLVEATVAAETLDEIMKSSAGPTQDLEGIADRMEDDMIRLRAINEGGLNPDSPTFDMDLALYKIDNKLDGYGLTAEEKIFNALQKVTGGVNDVISSFNDVDRILREGAFSNQNVSKIDTMTAAVQRLSDAAGGVASGFGMFDTALSGMQALAGLPAGMGKLMNSVSGGKIMEGLTGRGLPEHIAQAFLMNFQDESGLNPGAIEGKPNVHGTRGRGLAQWTGERRDALEGYAAGRGVSADDIEVQLDFLMTELKGDYRKVMEELLLTTDARTAAALLVRKFFIPAKEHQDRRAAAYLQGPQEILSNLTPESQNEVRTGAASAVAAEESAEERIRTNLPEYREMTAQEAARVYREGMEDARLAAAETEGDPTQGNAMKGLNRDILAGKVIPGGSTDINAPEYEEFRKIAEETDRIAASTAEQRRAQADIIKAEERLGEEQIQIAERVADARARMSDPNYRGMSKDLADLAESERDYLKAVEIRYGKESDEYRDAQNRMQDTRRQIQTAEGAESLLALQTRAEETERAAMSESDRRRADHADALSELAAERDFAIRSGVDKATAYAAYERGRMALLKQYQQESQSGLQEQLRGMSSLQDNLKNATASWPASLSEALYSQDWEALGDTMREGIARGLTDKAASLMMGPFTSMLEGQDGEGGLIGFADGLVNKMLGGQDKLTGALNSAIGGPGLLDGLLSGIKSLFGGAGGAGGGFLNFLSSFFSFGTAHKGAIIGKGFPGSTSIPALAFAGAPRYHTGGVIGRPAFKPSDFNLKRGEVPMVGMEGEGVFTKDQMKHLGGTKVSNAQSISLAPTINVNASGGTPEQNADLAKQISGETERAMRNVVRDELIKQMRPGNMLGRSN